jgi:hypothetical protein
MTTISDKAGTLLKTIQLTSDDIKRFDPRGSFGSQLEKCVGEAVILVDVDTVTRNSNSGEVELTVLKYAQETNERHRANCTIAYDLQNIFLSQDPTTSLLQIGTGNQGEDALKHLAYFTVDKVISTGIWPMKYSKAAEMLGYQLGKTDMERADWDALRKKYDSSDAMKGPREDATGDISWLEIKHVLISPME